MGSVRTRSLILAASFTAFLAVAGLALTAVLQLPPLIDLMIIGFSVVLLASSGAMIGLVITGSRARLA